MMPISTTRSASTSVASPPATPSQPSRIQVPPSFTWRTIHLTQARSNIPHRLVDTLQRHFFEPLGIVGDDTHTSYRNGGGGGQATATGAAGLMPPSSPAVSFTTTPPSPPPLGATSGEHHRGPDELYTIVALAQLARGGGSHRLDGGDLSPASALPPSLFANYRTFPPRYSLRATTMSTSPLIGASASGGSTRKHSTGGAEGGKEDITTGGHHEDDEDDEDGGRLPELCRVIPPRYAIGLQELTKIVESSRPAASVPMYATSTMDFNTAVNHNNNSNNNTSSSPTGGMSYSASSSASSPTAETLTTSSSLVLDANLIHTILHTALRELLRSRKAYDVIPWLVSCIKGWDFCDPIIRGTLCFNILHGCLPLDDPFHVQHVLQVWSDLNLLSVSHATYHDTAAALMSTAMEWLYLDTSARHRVSALCIVAHLVRQGPNCAHLIGLHRRDLFAALWNPLTDLHANIRELAANTLQVLLTVVLDRAPIHVRAPLHNVVALNGDAPDATSTPPLAPAGPHEPDIAESEEDVDVRAFVLKAVRLFTSGGATTGGGAMEDHVLGNTLRALPSTPTALHARLATGQHHGGGSDEFNRGGGGLPAAPTASDFGDSFGASAYHTLQSPSAASAAGSSSSGGAGGSQHNSSGGSGGGAVQPNMVHAGALVLGALIGAGQRIRIQHLRRERDAVLQQAVQRSLAAAVMDDPSGSELGESTSGLGGQPSITALESSEVIGDNNNESPFSSQNYFSQALHARGGGGGYYSQRSSITQSPIPPPHVATSSAAMGRDDGSSSWPLDIDTGGEGHRADDDDEEHDGYGGGGGDGSWFDPSRRFFSSEQLRCVIMAIVSNRRGVNRLFGCRLLPLLALHSPMAFMSYADAALGEMVGYALSLKEIVPPTAATASVTEKLHEDRGTVLTCIGMLFQALGSSMTPDSYLSCYEHQIIGLLDTYIAPNTQSAPALINKPRIDAAATALTLIVGSFTTAHRSTLEADMRSMLHKILQTNQLNVVVAAAATEIYRFFPALRRTAHEGLLRLVSGALRRFSLPPSLQSAASAHNLPSTRATTEAATAVAHRTDPFHDDMQHPQHVTTRLSALHVLRTLSSMYWSGGAVAYFLEVCVPYLHHPDAVVRRRCLECCAPLLRADCASHATAPASTQISMGILETSSWACVGPAWDEETKTTPPLYHVNTVTTTSRSMDILLPTAMGATSGVMPISVDDVSSETPAAGLSHRGRTHTALLQRVITRLLDVAVADRQPELRRDALSIFVPPDFDAFLINAQAVTSLFECMSDTAHENRHIALVIIGRISSAVPSLCIPRLRITFTTILDDLNGEMPTTTTHFVEDRLLFLFRLLRTLPRGITIPIYLASMLELLEQVLLLHGSVASVSARAVCVALTMTQHLFEEVSEQQWPLFMPFYELAMRHVDANHQAKMLCALNLLQVLVKSLASVYANPLVASRIHQAEEEQQQRRGSIVRGEAGRGGGVDTHAGIVTVAQLQATANLLHGWFRQRTVALTPNASIGIMRLLGALTAVENLPSHMTFVPLSEGSLDGSDARRRADAIVGLEESRIVCDGSRGWPFEVLQYLLSVLAGNVVPLNEDDQRQTIAAILRIFHSTPSVVRHIHAFLGPFFRLLEQLLRHARAKASPANEHHHHHTSSAKSGAQQQQTQDTRKNTDGKTKQQQQPTVASQQYVSLLETVFSAITQLLMSADASRSTYAHAATIVRLVRIHWDTDRPPLLSRLCDVITALNQQATEPLHEYVAWFVSSLLQSLEEYCGDAAQIELTVKLLMAIESFRGASTSNTLLLVIPTLCEQLLLPSIPDEARRHVGKALVRFIFSCNADPFVAKVVECCTYQLVESERMFAAFRATWDRRLDAIRATRDNKKRVALEAELMPMLDDASWTAYNIIRTSSMPRIVVNYATIGHKEVKMFPTVNPPPLDLERKRAVIQDLVAQRAEIPSWCYPWEAEVVAVICTTAGRCQSFELYHPAMTDLLATRFGRRSDVVRFFNSCANPTSHATLLRPATSQPTIQFAPSLLPPAPLMESSSSALSPPPPWASSLARANNDTPASPLLLPPQDNNHNVHRVPSTLHPYAYAGGGKRPSIHYFPPPGQAMTRSFTMPPMGGQSSTPLDNENDVTLTPLVSGQLPPHYSPLLANNNSSAGGGGGTQRRNTPMYMGQLASSNGGSPYASMPTSPEKQWMSRQTTAQYYSDGGVAQLSTPVQFGGGGGGGDFDMYTPSASIKITRRHDRSSLDGHHTAGGAGDHSAHLTPQQTSRNPHHQQTATGAEAGSGSTTALLLSPSKRPFRPTFGDPMQEQQQLLSTSNGGNDLDGEVPLSPRGQYAGQQQQLDAHLQSSFEQHATNRTVDFKAWFEQLVAKFVQRSRYVFISACDDLVRRHYVIACALFPYAFLTHLSSCNEFQRVEWLQMLEAFECKHRHPKPGHHVPLEIMREMSRLAHCIRRDAAVLFPGSTNTGVLGQYLSDATVVRLAQRALQIPIAANYLEQEILEQAQWEKVPHLVELYDHANMQQELQSLRLQPEFKQFLVQHPDAITPKLLEALGEVDAAVRMHTNNAANAELDMVQSVHGAGRPKANSLATRRNMLVGHQHRRSLRLPRSVPQSPSMAASSPVATSPPTADVSIYQSLDIAPRGSAKIHVDDHTVVHSIAAVMRCHNHAFQFHKTIAYFNSLQHSSAHSALLGSTFRRSTTSSPAGVGGNSLRRRGGGGGGGTGTMHPELARHVALAAHCMSNWSLVSEICSAAGVKQAQWASSRHGSLSNEHGIPLATAHHFSKELLLYSAASDLALGAPDDALHTMERLREQLMDAPTVLHAESTKRHNDLNMMVMCMTDLEEATYALRHQHRSGGRAAGEGGSNAVSPTFMSGGRGDENVVGSPITSTAAGAIDVNGFAAAAPSELRLLAIGNRPLPFQSSALHLMQAISFRAAFVPKIRQLRNLLVLCENLCAEGRQPRAQEILFDALQPRAGGASFASPVTDHPSNNPSTPGTLALQTMVMLESLKIGLEMANTDANALQRLRGEIHSVMQDGPMHFTSHHAPNHEDSIGWWSIRNGGSGAGGSGGTSIGGGMQVPYRDDLRWFEAGVELKTLEMEVLRRLHGFHMFPTSRRGGRPSPNPSYAVMSKSTSATSLSSPLSWSLWSAPDQRDLSVFMDVIFHPTEEVIVQQAQHVSEGNYASSLKEFSLLFFDVCKMLRAEWVDMDHDDEQHLHVLQRYRKNASECVMALQRAAATCIKGYEGAMTQIGAAPTANNPTHAQPGALGGPMEGGSVGSPTSRLGAAAVGTTTGSATISNSMPTNPVNAAGVGHQPYVSKRRITTSRANLVVSDLLLKAVNMAWNGNCIQDLNTSPDTIASWALIGPYLAHFAARSRAIQHMVLQMCQQSLGMLSQLGFSLIATFESIGSRMLLDDSNNNHQQQQQPSFNAQQHSAATAGNGGAEADMSRSPATSTIRPPNTKEARSARQRTRSFIAQSPLPIHTSDPNNGGEVIIVDDVVLDTHQNNNNTSANERTAMMMMPSTSTMHMPPQPNLGSPEQHFTDNNSTFQYSMPNLQIGFKTHSFSSVGRTSNGTATIDNNSSNFIQHPPTTTSGQAANATQSNSSRQHGGGGHHNHSPLTSTTTPQQRLGATLAAHVSMAAWWEQQQRALTEATKSVGRTSRIHTIFVAPTHTAATTTTSMHRSQDNRTLGTMAEDMPSMVQLYQLDTDEGEGGVLPLLEPSVMQDTPPVAEGVDGSEDQQRYRRLTLPPDVPSDLDLLAVMSLNSPSVARRNTVTTNDADISEIGSLLRGVVAEVGTTAAAVAVGDPNPAEPPAAQPLARASSMRRALHSPEYRSLSLPRVTSFSFAAGNVVPPAILGRPSASPVANHQGQQRHPGEPAATHPAAPTLPALHHEVILELAKTSPQHRAMIHAALKFARWMASGTEPTIHFSQDNQQQHPGSSNSGTTNVSGGTHWIPGLRGCPIPLPQWQVRQQFMKPISTRATIVSARRCAVPKAAPPYEVEEIVWLTLSDGTVIKFHHGLTSNSEGGVHGGAKDDADNNGSNNNTNNGGTKQSVHAVMCSCNQLSMVPAAASTSSPFCSTATNSATSPKHAQFEITASTTNQPGGGTPPRCNLRPVSIVTTVFASLLEKLPLHHIRRSLIIPLSPFNHLTQIMLPMTLHASTSTTTASTSSSARASGGSTTNPAVAPPSLGGGGGTPITELPKYIPLRHVNLPSMYHLMNAYITNKLREEAATSSTTTGTEATVVGSKRYRREAARLADLYDSGGCSGVGIDQEEGDDTTWELMRTVLGEETATTLVGDDAADKQASAATSTPRDHDATLVEADVTSPLAPPPPQSESPFHTPARDDTSLNTRTRILRSRRSAAENHLRTMMVMEAHDPSQWFTARTTFSKQLAEWSMVQYVFDVSCRCPAYLLIDLSSGHVTELEVGGHALPPCARNNTDTWGGGSTATTSLRSNLATRDSSVFRMTSALQNALPMSSPHSGFLLYAAEGLRQLHLVKRELIGLLEYGLESIRIKQDPVSPTSRRQSTNLHHAASSGRQPFSANASFTSFRASMTTPIAAGGPGGAMSSARHHPLTAPRRASEALVSLEMDGVYDDDNNHSAGAGGGARVQQNVSPRTMGGGNDEVPMEAPGLEADEQDDPIVCFDTSSAIVRLNESLLVAPPQSHCRYDERRRAVRTRSRSPPRPPAPSRNLPSQHPNSILQTRGGGVGGVGGVTGESSAGTTRSTSPIMADGVSHHTAIARGHHRHDAASAHAVLLRTEDPAPLNEKLPSSMDDFLYSMHKSAMNRIQRFLLRCVVHRRRAKQGAVGGDTNPLAVSLASIDDQRTTSSSSSPAGPLVNVMLGTSMISNLSLPQATSTTENGEYGAAVVVPDHDIAGGSGGGSLQYPDHHHHHHHASSSSLRTPPVTFQTGLGSPSHVQLPTANASIVPSGASLSMHSGAPPSTLDASIFSHETMAASVAATTEHQQLQQLEPLIPGVSYLAVHTYQQRVTSLIAAATDEGNIAGRYWDMQPHPWATWCPHW